jgi:hypothetical protein
MKQQLNIAEDFLAAQAGGTSSFLAPLASELFQSQLQWELACRGYKNLAAAARVQCKGNLTKLWRMPLCFTGKSQRWVSHSNFQATKHAPSQG